MSRITFWFVNTYTDTHMQTDTLKTILASAIAASNKVVIVILALNEMTGKTHSKVVRPTARSASHPGYKSYTCSH